MRHANGPGKAHRMTQFAAGHVVIAFKLDPAYLNFWPLADHERQVNRSRRQRPHLTSNRCELVAMLSFERLDRNFRLLDFGGVVLRFGRQPDFVLLETVENIALGNGIYPRVINLLHSGAFFYVNVKDPAFGRGLTLKADVFEESRVPQRVEVSLNCCLIINIARMGKDVRFDHICGHTAVPVDLNLHDQVLLGKKWRGKAH